MPHVITIVQGEMEFVVADKTIQLRELDQIYIPPETMYSFRNKTQKDAKMMGIRIGGAQH